MMLCVGVAIGMLLFYVLYHVRGMCGWFSDGDRVKHDIIKTLLRQSARWSTAATQDKAPMIAVLHANYGAGYLYALMDIATPEEIESVTGVDIMKYKSAITGAQDAATVAAISKCPEFGPEPSYLTSLGGEGRELAG